MSSIGPGNERPERREAPSESVIQPGGARSEREEKRSARVVAGGSLTEAIASIAAVALTILGLAGVLPGYMAAIATILVGVALLAQGSAVAARWSRLLSETSGYEWDVKTEIGSGMTAELFAGAAGVILGVLALLGIAPSVLIPVALLVFGGAMLVGSGTTADLGQMRPPGAPERLAHTTREISVAASGTQLLIGVAAIVLGIIALVSVASLLVSLVGLLAVGVSTLFSGSALTSRMFGALRR